MDRAKLDNDFGVDEQGGRGNNSIQGGKDDIQFPDINQGRTPNNNNSKLSMSQV